MHEERVIACVDGFNLYHAIDALNRPHLKWVDLWALASSFLRSHQGLAAVNYYSAYAAWMPDAHARHRQYTNALRASGVHVHISEFRDRPQYCNRCGNQWTGHEEKQTDVRIAVDVVSNCLENQFNVAIVVTADSDLSPAVAKVPSVPGKRVLTIAPRGRFNRARDLQFSHQIRPGRIGDCLFPQEVTENGRIVAIRPPQYDPPA